MDHKYYFGNNTNLNKMLKITGSVSLITVLGFSQVSYLMAEEPVVPTTSRVNLEPISVNYGDIDTIANVSKTILKDKVNLLSKVTLVSQDEFKSVYVIDRYVVTVFCSKQSGLGLMDVKMTIENRFTHQLKDTQKLIAVNDQSSNEIMDGVINVYNISVNIKDNVSPVISLSSESATIYTTDSFDLSKYVSVNDDVDGVLTYTTENEPVRENNQYKAGTYAIKINAVDSSGNTSTRDFTLTIKEKPIPTNSFSNSGSAFYWGTNPDTSHYLGPDVMVRAAYAQLGRKQDCTMLVSNALKAAGISFHGAPARYFYLGHQVSEAEAIPGDIVYYRVSGSGVPHVALYVGNGMAIHGGYNGTTKLASVYMGSGPVFIRVDKK